MYTWASGLWLMCGRCKRQRQHTLHQGRPGEAMICDYCLSADLREKQPE